MGIIISDVCSQTEAGHREDINGKLGSRWS